LLAAGSVDTLRRPFVEADPFAAEDAGPVAFLPFFGLPPRFFQNSFSNCLDPLEYANKLGQRDVG
jgi:hypothetical protein